MSGKIILVTQRVLGRQAAPLSDAAGRRLAALAEIDLAELLRRFEFVTLLPKDWQGSGEEAARAMLDQAELLRAKWRDRKVVLLGQTVAISFRLRENIDYQWFQPVVIPPGIEVAVMPNPGGVSNWWNDPKNTEVVRRFMLRLNVGFLAIQRAGIKAVRGRPESFTPDQVAAALVASDGLLLQAAELLAEETGVHTSRQVLAQYCERYPALQEIRQNCKAGIGDIAEKNVGGAVRDGALETSRWLLRSNMFTNGKDNRGYGLTVQGRVNGHVQHDHRHAHLHAKLNGAGLDLSRYSEAQLDAIADFTRVLNAPAAAGDLAAGPAPGGGVGAGQEGES